MSNLTNSSAKRSQDEPSRFFLGSRAICRGLLGIGLLAASLAIAGPASADSGAVAVQWLAAQPIKVESDGSKYTAVDNTAGPINGAIIVDVDAEVSGRVKSWHSWPMIRLDQDMWEDFTQSSASESYSVPRPKTVHTGYPFTIPRAQYATFMVYACNYHADRLRQQGLSNNEIFGQDREYKLSLSAGLEYETSGIKGSSVPQEVDAWELYPTVTLICEAGLEPLDPVKPEITASSLFVKEAESVKGSCELRLAGSVITKEPNTEVKFRYLDDQGKQSDVKTVVTNAGRIAIFEHSYPLGAGTAKSGKIQMVGVNPPFLSKWVDYEANCAVASGDKVSVLPPEAFHLEAIPTGDTVMHRGLVCPAKLKIYGIIKGRGAVSGAVALFAGGQIKALKPYDIEDGQTIVVEGEHTLTWGPTQAQQNLKFAMNVTNAAAKLVDQMEKTQNFTCSAVSTGGVAQGAAGGYANATPAPLPSQQAQAGQLTLRQPLEIQAPKGLVRSGQVRLSGGLSGATYALKFYRKNGGSYAPFQSGQLPKQMTGSNASFPLAALTGGTDWRIEVCPLGGAQSACETSDFRLPAIGTKAPAEPQPKPFVIAPGTMN